MTRNQLVQQALEKIPMQEVLINVVAKRVRQLGQGQRPLVFVTPKMTFMDVALLEVAEGKLGYEVIEAEAVAK